MRESVRERKREREREKELGGETETESNKIERDDGEQVEASERVFCSILALSRSPLLFFVLYSPAAWLRELR